jgi:hypothetical protein
MRPEPEDSDSDAEAFVADDEGVLGEGDHVVADYGDSDGARRTWPGQALKAEMIDAALVHHVSSRGLRERGC